MENNVETVLTGNAENTVINAEMQNIDENAGVEIFEPPVSTENEKTPEANTPKTENTAKVTPKVEKKTEVKAATDATTTDATTADTTGLVDTQTEETTETVLVVDETPASALANSNEALVMTAYVAIIVVAATALGMMMMNFVKNFRDGLPKSKKAKKSKKKSKKSKKTAKSKKKAKTTKTKKK